MLETTTDKPKAPRVPRGVMQKSKLLLHMEYKPAELAEELQVTVKTIYQVWLPAGLPFRRDKTNHVWIVGTETRAWLETIVTQSQERPKVALGENQAFCVGCKKAVMVSGITRRRFGRAGLLSGNCQVCGASVKKIIKASEV